MGVEDQLTQARIKNAQAIARHGGIAAAVQSGQLPERLDATLSELIVLGLLKQGVRQFFTVFGHGSTDIGEVLRIYQDAGLVRVFGLRSEIEASHAAAALNWVSGQTAAVITSIGPGALQALAASLVPASDGLGVWYLMGDETTEDEGFNMQQIPKHEQHLFLNLAATMGKAYSLHTPSALPTALRRGANCVHHPFKPAPFYLLAPMNTQAVYIHDFNLRELPDVARIEVGPASQGYDLAAAWIRQSQRVLVKIGGGARNAAMELAQFLELADAVCVHTPMASGILPYTHPRCMAVGGSKGSLCGNYAMEHADLLVAIGTRAVCQSDSSRTGYPNVKRVVNINPDIDDATHYADTLALVGDAAATLSQLNVHLEKSSQGPCTAASKWLTDCQEQKNQWETFKQLRYERPVLPDAFWGKEVLTQPAAIKTTADWAQGKDIVFFFDAGDVQANGFQVITDSRPGQSFTDTGASYMGFAVSALLASAALQTPPFFLAFTGDGSFTMSPQVLIDGMEYGARGCILMLDNNRMGAISGLQQAQYGQDFATFNHQPVDYLRWAESVPGVLALSGGTSPAKLRAALDRAYQHPALSLVHVPVYYGENPLGGMGVFGRWNVGNWVEETQYRRHQIGL